MVWLLKRGHRDEEGDEAYDSTLQIRILQGVNSNSPTHDEDAFFQGQWDVVPGPPRRVAQIDRSLGVRLRSQQNDGGGAAGSPPYDMELMKDRFAKLLLSEDMSGGGKRVSSALALSNAITNLAGNAHSLPVSLPDQVRKLKQLSVLALIENEKDLCSPSSLPSSSKDAKSLKSTDLHVDIIDIYAGQKMKHHLLSTRRRQESLGLLSTVSEKICIRSSFCNIALHSVV